MENLVLSSSNLVGNDVKSRSGENLGTVKDVVIDMETGKVAYLVLAFGGFLGLGNKYLAIPLSSFNIDTVDERLVLNVEKERLKNAPGFDSENLPSHPQKEFLNQVNDYYGKTPQRSLVSDDVVKSPFEKKSENEWVRDTAEVYNTNLFKNAPNDTNTRNRDLDPDRTRSNF